MRLMLLLRLAEDRGRGDYGWLQAAYGFSFAHYYDPEWVGFRNLRVVNEDRIAGRNGFGEHGHRDMEILTYVLSGTLEHQDSEGNIGHLRAGMVQRMTAGRGMRHSEWNREEEELHLYQIWIQPELRGLAPSYQEMAFPREGGGDGLSLLASPAAGDGILTMHADASLWAGTLPAGASLVHDLAAGRHAWVQVAGGQLRVDGQVLHAGDGAGISAQDSLTLEVEEDAEVLLFDLA